MFGLKIVDVKAFGPAQLKPVAPGATAVIYAVAFWQIFGGTVIATEEVATTETLAIAPVVQVKTPFEKEAVTV